MPRTLNLSIDTFSIALGDLAHSKFEPNGYERITDSSGSVEYSLTGAAIEDGKLYEPKFVWTVSAYLDSTQWQTLQAIYLRAERKRRTQQAYGIVCDDFIQPYVEDALIATRALAPGGAIVVRPSFIEYPARFAVRMFEPKARHVNNAHYRYLVSFVLRELDRVPS